MDWDTLIKLGSLFGGTTTVAALYRWAKAQGRADALAEASTKTIVAKNDEIAQMKKTHAIELQRRDAEISELKAENQRLWSMFDSLTTPPEA